MKFFTIALMFVCSVLYSISKEYDKCSHIVMLKDSSFIYIIGEGIEDSEVTYRDTIDCELKTIDIDDIEFISENPTYKSGLRSIKRAREYTEEYNRIHRKAFLRTRRKK
jgi:hypothetical protein